MKVSCFLDSGIAIADINEKELDQLREHYSLHETAFPVEGFVLALSDALEPLTEKDFEILQRRVRAFKYSI